MDIEKAIKILDRSEVMVLNRNPKEFHEAANFAIDFLKEHNKKPKKRKYFRKCVICGLRLEQSSMVRTSLSPNGWICYGCYIDTYPEEGE